MRAWLLTVFASLGLFCANPGQVHADASSSFVREKHYDIIFDAKGGTYDDDVKKLGSGKPTALRAAMTIQKLDRSVPLWASRFGFALSNGNSIVGFHVDAGPHSALTMAIRLIRDGREQKRLDFAFKPELGEKYLVEMSWTSAGNVTASVLTTDGAERHEIDLGLAPQELRVSASGGRVEIAPLEFGHIANR